MPEGFCPLLVLRRVCLPSLGHMGDTIHSPDISFTILIDSGVKYHECRLEMHKQKQSKAT